VNDLRIGPFRLHALVGRGAVGEVWRGEHLERGVAVAVKLITGAPARNEAWQASFRNEVRSAARLDHPHVILLLDHGRTDAALAAASGGRFAEGTPWLVMEHASGGSLSALRGPIRWRRARSVLVALLRALAHAHARGVIHRDLKAANVLICGPGDVRPGWKLGDFGIARAEGAAAETQMVGTPSYMAPELVTGRWRDQGPWTDLYALGNLAWRLVVGRTPFQHLEPMATLQAQLSEVPPPLPARVAVPDGLATWVSRLLEKEPSARYDRAAHALADLLALAEVDDPALPPTEGPPEGVLTWIDGPTPATTGPLPPPPVERAPAPAGRADPPLAPLPIPESPFPPPSPERPLAGVGLGLFGLRPPPLADRDTEAEVVWALLTEVVSERRSRGALLHGPTGVGKSRIAAFVAERALELGVAEVLRVTCDADADGLRLAFSRALGLEGLAPDAARARLSTLGWTSELARLAFGEVGVEAVVRHAVWREAMDRSALPWVIVLDDAQVGADALAFVEGLLREDAPTAPALVLACVDDAQLAQRPVEQRWVERMVARGDLLRLPLAPLSDAATTALARQWLDLEPGLAGRVAARAGGNPQLLVQILTSLVTRGVLRPTPAGYALLPGAPADLPDDLAASWAARVEPVRGALSPAGRRAVDVAAALGVEVDGTLWSEACDPDARAAWGEVVERFSVSGLGTASGGGFTFAHAMAREAWVAGPGSEARTRAAHAACARAFAARGGDPSRLGRHLLAAARPREAIDPLLEGAEALSRTTSHLDALAVLADADDALGHAAVDDPRRGAAAALRCNLLRVLGYPEEATIAADRGLALAQRYRWPTLLSLKLARAQVGLVHADPETGPRLRGLLAEALASRDPALIGKAFFALSGEAQFRGDPEAASLAEKALSHLSRAGDLLLVAHCLRQLATLRSQASPDAAQAMLEQALDAYERLGSRMGMAYCWNALAEVHRQRGDLELAEDLYRRCLGLLEATGDADVVVARLNLALVALARGQGADAYAAVAPIRVALERRNRRFLLAVALLVQLPHLAAEREWETFEAGLRRAVELVVATGVHDRDLAWLFELAAEAAGTGPRKATARVAWRQAARQWQHLGQGARAERASAEANAGAADPRGPR
jgi:serine/threonine protein kinase/tetratricopeptide (TPR) repeat protein